MASTKQSPFLFVASTGIGRAKDADKQTRRNIRQHVMRDIGRARRKRPRNPQFELQLVRAVESAPEPPAPPPPPPTTTSLPASCAAVDDDEHVRRQKRLCLERNAQTSLNRAFWAEHPFAIIDAHWPWDAFVPYAFSMALSAQERKPDSHAGCYWFPWAFNDSSFFRALLTGPHMKQAILGGRPQERSKILALDRYQQILKCLQGTISNPKVELVTTNRVIRGIIGLICYNYVTREFEQAKVHLDGLERLVSLRGGLASLEDEPETVLMLFWIDVTAALILDCEPRFELPAFTCLHIDLRPHQNGDLTSLYDGLFNLCSGSQSSNIEIIKCIQELQAVCEAIELHPSRHGRELWRDDFFLGSKLNPIAYKLLSSPLRPQETSEPRTFWEGARLGAIIFIVCLKQMSHVFPGSGATYISSALNNLTASDVDERSPKTAAYLSLRLWALFICATTSQDSSECITAAVAIAETMERAGLTSWEDVMRSVKRMPWIDEVFSARLDVVKKDVMKLLDGKLQ